MDRRDTDPSPPLGRLVESLRERHGAGVAAALFYGSCLRSGDLGAGLIDLYLVVDDYRSVYGRSWRALANALLPPNVFYTELALDEVTLRCKYAIVSTRDFERALGPGRFEAYFWGRFCQPTRIAWARDPAVAAGLRTSLDRAAATLLQKALPALPAAGTVEALWRDALALSYGTELRSERSGRAAELVGHDRDHYRRQLEQALPVLPFRVRVSELARGTVYDASVPAWRRRIARISWPLRGAVGKFWSLLRLVKALFTFDGGLEYIEWKLTRHSGQPVRLSRRTHRWPLLFVWGDMWRLYRRGVFR